MKKYIVTVREVWCQGYEVEASSKEDARKQLVQKFRGQSPQPIEELFEFSHRLYSDQWDVEGPPPDKPKVVTIYRNRWRRGIEYDSDVGSD